MELLLSLPILVALVLLPFLVIMTPFRWRKQTKRLSEIDQRLSRLETAITALRHRVSTGHVGGDQAPGKASTLAVEPAASPAEPVSKPAAPVAANVTVREPQPKSQQVKSTAPPPSPAHIAEVGEGVTAHPPVESSAIPMPPAPPQPAIEHVSVPSGAAAASAGRGKWFSSILRHPEDLRPVRVPSDWETRVGRLWLNVIGIVVLVVGVVLLIGYSLRYLGPSGKVATGLSVAVALLGIGVVLERLERYRAFARALIGGGWAIAYFTAYAAYNVYAAKVIQDPLWAMPVMILVALGMIAHSFRYRSQVVTGLAYGLAFFAIAISPINSYSLGAVAVLGGSMVAVLRIQPWYHLGMAGVIGSYLCFGLWYRSVTISQVMLSAENLLTGIAVLALYWLLFALSPFVRRPASANDRQAILLLSMANGSSFLGFGVALVRLNADPAHLPSFMLLAALAFSALAYLHRRIRLHMTFLLHALTATVLLAFSAPVLISAHDISVDWLALPWAVEAGVVLALGLHLREIWLRIASYLLAGLVVGVLFGFTLQGGAEGRQLVLWVSVPLVVAFFFFTFELLKSRAGHGDVLAQARPVALAFGYLATALLAAFAWVESPRAYVAVVWLALGVALFEIGVRNARPHVRLQGLSLIGGAAVALMLIDILGLGVASAPTGTPLWLMAAGVAAVHHWVPERVRIARASGTVAPADASLGMASAYLGTIVLAVLLWHEFEVFRRAPAWLVLGVALVEIGRLASRSYLLLQGLLLAGAALPVLLLVNLYSVTDSEVPEGISRWLVVGGCGLAYHWLSERSAKEPATDVGVRLEGLLAPLASYAGTVVLSILVWVEMDSVSVAVCWALMGLVLFELGERYQRVRLRRQSNVLLIAVFARLFLANFTALGALGGVSHRVLSVSPVIAILYYLWDSLRERARAGVADLADRGMQSLYSFFAAVALVLLARFELGRADAVLAWAPLVVLFLVLGVTLKERDFRLQSYALAVLTFAQSWATNLTLTGTVFGLSQRLLNTGVVIAAFTVATGYCLAYREAFAELGKSPRRIDYFDSRARILFSALATVLLALLLAYELESRWITMAWTIQAFAVLALGFALVERCLRLYGLTLVLICLVKLVLLDLQDVETIYRILSYIILGVILLLMSLGYARYQHLVRRFL